MWKVLWRGAWDIRESLTLFQYNRGGVFLCMEGTNDFFLILLLVWRKNDDGIGSINRLFEDRLFLIHLQHDLPF